MKFSPSTDVDSSDGEKSMTEEIHHVEEACAHSRRKRRFECVSNTVEASVLLILEPKQRRAWLTIWILWMRRVHDKAKKACLQSLQEENAQIRSEKMNIT